jgi:predicted lactoylglutathione lyase
MADTSDRGMFVNLAVRDLEKSKDFFSTDFTTTPPLRWATP